MIKIECAKRSNCTQGFDECDSETEGRLWNDVSLYLQPGGGTVVLLGPEKTQGQSEFEVGGRH